MTVLLVFSFLRALYLCMYFANHKCTDALTRPIQSVGACIKYFIAQMLQLRSLNLVTS